MDWDMYGLGPNRDIEHKVKRSIKLKKYMAFPVEYRCFLGPQFKKPISEGDIRDGDAWTMHGRTKSWLYCETSGSKS